MLFVDPYEIYGPYSFGCFSWIFKESNLQFFTLPRVFLLWISSVSQRVDSWFWPVSFHSLTIFSGKFKLSLFLDIVAKIQSEKVSATTRNTRSKMALQAQKIKDHNAGVFTDTSGYVSDSSYVDWSRIYVIFYSDDFLSVAHDQPFYMHIQNS